MILSLNLNTLTIAIETQSQLGSLCPPGSWGCSYIPDARAENNLTYVYTTWEKKVCRFQSLPPSGVSLNPSRLLFSRTLLDYVMKSARPQVKPLPSQIPPTIFFVRDSTKK